jgi:hypothetical protein
VGGPQLEEMIGAPLELELLIRHSLRGEKNDRRAISNGGHLDIEIVGHVRAAKLKIAEDGAVRNELKNLTGGTAIIDHCGKQRGREPNCRHRANRDTST